MGREEEALMSIKVRKMLDKDASAFFDAAK
jgi:hypothetical protein